MYKNMKAAALLTTAVLLTGCGASVQAAEADETKEAVTASVTAEAVPAEQTAETNVVTSAVTTMTTTARPAVETTAVETTAAETQALKEPTAIKKDILSGHRFSTSDFPKKVYSNKKLKKAFEEIDKLCDSFGYDLSFEYENLETGAQCSYNNGRYYGCCSTIKAPFCKYLLESGIDLDEKVKITELWYPYVDTVSDAGYGSKFTARELIRLAITESDNSAYMNLVKKYGFEGFNEMNAELGANYYLGYDYYFNECTAADLLKEYEDIFFYAQDTKRGEWLTKLMRKTDLETQITAELKDKYPVSHKYGSDIEQECYHDCAICYADSPFILIIMTEQVPETDTCDKIFRKLAKQFDIVNEQLAWDQG